MGQKGHGMRACVCVCVCVLSYGKGKENYQLGTGFFVYHRVASAVNHLTPNGHYMGRTAQLTSRRCILYIYSTNIRTEYFKHAA